MLGHAFGNALQDSQAAEKKNPNQPAGDRGVADDHTAESEAMSLQLRVLLEFGKCEMAANHSGTRHHEKEAATKSTQTKHAKDERQNGERLGLGRRRH